MGKTSQPQAQPATTYGAFDLAFAAFEEALTAGVTGVQLIEKRMAVHGAVQKLVEAARLQGTLTNLRSAVDAIEHRKPGHKAPKQAQPESED